MFNLLAKNATFFFHFGENGRVSFIALQKERKGTVGIENSSLFLGLS